MSPLRGLLRPLSVPLAVAVPALLSLALLAPAPATAAPVAATGTTTVATERAEARNPTRTFLTLNVAGRLENRGRVDPVAGDLVRAVRSRQPFAAVLQEVCGNQAWAANRRLPSYRVAFFPTGVRCEGGQGFGNAVLIRNGPLTRRQEPLPTGGQGSRNIGCVSRPSPKVAICSTHLTADRNRPATRLEQAEKVARVSEGFVRRGFATFVGGDFNDTPGADTLDPLYRPAYGQGARGIFTESDGCCGRDGAPTLGTVKFDYGFASWKWRVVRDWVAEAPSSDHNRLWTVLRRK